MKREVIEFLKKNGYTFEEIMNLDSGTDNGTGTDTGTDTGTVTDKGTETKKTENTDTAEKTLAEQLAELRGELKALRDITHAENRNRDVIENPGKKLSFEEDVEKLIEEVNK